MNNDLTAFAAIKVFYEEGNDLIQIFAHLVLLVFSDDAKRSLLDVQQSFSSKTQINIPVDVLSTILKRLKKENLIDYQTRNSTDTRTISLTEEGVVLREKIKQSYEDANRERSALVKDLNKYLQGKGIPLSEDGAAKKLAEFIEKNSEVAVAGLAHAPNTTQLNDSSFQYIFSYFIETERSNPENFGRLKSILYGKLIANTFVKRNFEKGAKLEKLTVYLDTNIIFSLMGFHEDSYNNSVKEVVDLIKKAGCQIKVLSFTIDEINIKLGGYLSEYGYYSSVIRVGSIYSVLKRRGYSRVQIISLMENMEDRLRELGVIIDYSFDLENLLLNKDDVVSEFSAYKNHSHHINSIQHDIGAIYAIRKLRNSSVFNWEKSKAIFLTADYSLARFNYEKEHRDRNTFPEVSYRTDMASMLWLKGQSGSDNVFVHNFLANYTREKFISKNIWDKFITELKAKKVAGKISSSEIEEIISYSETEKILFEKGERGIATLLDDRNINKIKEERLKQEKEIVENEELIKSQNEQLVNVMDGIRSDCRRVIKFKINASIWAITVIAVCAIGYTVYCLGIEKTSVLIGLFPIAAIIFLAISVTQKSEFVFLNFILQLRNNFENRKLTECISEKKKLYKISSERKSD
ncbi:MAG: hypothetical protein JWO73_11 [Candidatus Taylorbacteria bacterium]|nr:hypothetical protein [Candidatus Taylorbacteria bacterium]